MNHVISDSGKRHCSVYPNNGSSHQPSWDYADSTLEQSTGVVPITADTMELCFNQDLTEEWNTLSAWKEDDSVNEPIFADIFDPVVFEDYANHPEPGSYPINEVDTTDNMDHGQAISQYDTCFGVVNVPVMSSFRSKKSGSQIPVQVKTSGDRLKIYTEDRNEYAGVISVSQLADVTQKFRVKLRAKLFLSEDKLEKRSRLPKGINTEFPAPRECLIRIVICGLVSDADAIGTLLSEAGLYLQHPSVNDFDRELEYSNPHYLLRPGAPMPRLSDSDTITTTHEVAAPGALDEFRKAQLMQLFDTANEERYQPSAEPSKRLNTILRPHQLVALSTMIETECGGPTGLSLWEASKRGFRNKVTDRFEETPRSVLGGILADDMGLGKTLTVLALVCGSLDYSDSQGATLIVAPKSTIYNWQKQAKRHIKCDQMKIVTYVGSERQSKFAETLYNSQIVITSYETMRSDYPKGLLHLHRWHRIVLDEAHRIRSPSSQTFKAAYALQARHRWCLTGTPIHNSLCDYYSLLAFVGVDNFADKSVFDFWITTPLKKSEVNSLRNVQNLIRGTCLRRTKRTLNESLRLPQHTQRVEWVEFDTRERELYDFFKKRTAEIASGAHGYRNKQEESTGSRTVTLINFLRRICDHGEHLLPPSALAAWQAGTSESINWQTMCNTGRTCSLCECMPLDERSDSGGYACPQCAAVTDKFVVGKKSPLQPVLPSSKMKALLANLHREQASANDSLEPPTKSVVFSSWTGMLDLVQSMLQSNGFLCARIDGQNTLKDRECALYAFNEDQKCTVMLASIGSAGEGIDFTVASHVHLLEPLWNPNG